MYRYNDTWYHLYLA